MAESLLENTNNKNQRFSQIQKQINNYLLFYDNEIGQGSTGKVYLGYMKTNPLFFLGIKQISCESPKDYLLQNKLIKIGETIGIIQNMNHPNINQIIDKARTSRNLYIITEFCNQKDLKSLISALSFDESLIFLKQIVKAMLYANSKHIIHRNLKPSKILIDKGIIKINGFGLNEINDYYNKYIIRVGLSQMVNYYAPEILNEEKYDEKCDVWSVGIMFYEMIFKRLPWEGAGVYHLYQNILKNPLQFNKNVSINSEIIDLIKNMLKIDKETRFSFKEVNEHIVLLKNTPDIFKNKKLKKKK